MKPNLQSEVLFEIDTKKIVKNNSEEADNSQEISCLVTNAITNRRNLIQLQWESPLADRWHLTRWGMCTEFNGS